MKFESAFGVAVSVTPVAKLNVCVPPTRIGLTVPPPLPFATTLMANCCSVKVAVTVRAWSNRTVQVLVPLHPPLQPTKLEPVAGVAVNVTGTMAANGVLQVDPLVQFTPAGSLVTVPLPLPSHVTLRSVGAAAGPPLMPTPNRSPAGF
jgi:hypothetical protein